MRNSFKVIHIRKRYLLLLAICAVVLWKFCDLAMVRWEEHNISTLSYVMANKVVVIDPGHGGIDPGKVGRGGLQEKVINLAVAKRLANIFNQSGATAMLTRETDTDLSSDGRVNLLSKKREDLARRVALANDNHADVMLSIHCNSFPEPDEHGAQVFSQPGQPESAKLAKCIQDEMTILLKNTTRVPKQVDYFVNRNSKMPSVIVEIGFISNPTEEQMLQDPAYQTKVAWSIYAGVVKYLANQSQSDESKQKADIIRTFQQNTGENIGAP